MKKSWGVTQKILAGKKKVESRWYKARHAPWGMVHTGDTVYFKNSGEPVTVVAEVYKVLQFSDLTPQQVRDIFDTYGKDIGVDQGDISEYVEMFKDKKYCILIFLKNAKLVQPFHINKKGFGAMAAWITVDIISNIRATYDSNVLI